jgi:hypothetical protein
LFFQLGQNFLLRPRYSSLQRNEKEGLILEKILASKRAW